MQGLTPRQFEIKSFIESCAVSPTYREIQAHFGLRSISHVQSHLLRLEKKSAIRRIRYEHRGIQLTGAALAPTPA